MNYYDILLARKLNGGGGGGYQLETKSGDLISYANGVNLPINKCIVDITAKQDLHGQDAPYPAGGGKNLLPMTVDGFKAVNTSGTWSDNTYSINSISYTLVTDDDNIIGIKADGTSTTNYPNFYIPTFVIPAGQYVLSGCSEQTGSIIYIKSNVSANYSDTSTSFTLTADTTIDSARICVANKNPADNAMFYPMIRLASASADFAPYSNICPIVGWDEANLWIQDVVDTTANPTATADFNTTVYGGSADLINGVLSDTQLMEVFDNTAMVTFGRDGQANWYYVITSGQAANVAGLPRSNQYLGAEIGNSNDNLGIQKLPNGYVRIRVGGEQPASVDDFVASLGVKPLQVLTPITGAAESTFTPIPTTNTLTGVNNIYADCGSINEIQVFTEV